MNKRNDIQRELNKHAPTLANLAKKEPFHAPPAYFDQFPERIHAQLPNQDRKIPLAARLAEIWANLATFFLRPSYASALSVFILLAITTSYAYYFHQQAGQSMQSSLTLKQPSNQEISAYVTNNLEMFDQQEIIEERGKQHNAAIDKETFQLEKIDAQELDQYIMTNIQQKTIRDELP